ncbi:hypothetical protein HAX54_053498, partial [Datura stramonium]|nr:hypothetical protein [Datura stramonium]
PSPFDGLAGASANNKGLDLNSTSDVSLSSNSMAINTKRYRREETLGLAYHSGTVVYNVTEIRKAIVVFVILDEQPFKVVEGEGFKKINEGCFALTMIFLRIIVARQKEKFLEDEINVDNKSDLEKYLLDDLEKTKNLNILAWWKASS